MAAVLTLTHIGSAVLPALVAAPLVSRTLGTAGRAFTFEHLSRGMLLLILVWLIARAVRTRDGVYHPHSGEGVMVGIVAGLIPCPLTLFTMFFALSRGVPEAGLTFTFAMMLGVGLTLALVAVVAVLARERFVGLVVRHGASLRASGEFSTEAQGWCPWSSHTP